MVRLKPDATYTNMVRLKPGATYTNMVRLKPDATYEMYVASAFRRTQVAQLAFRRTGVSLRTRCRTSSRRFWRVA